MIEFYHQGCLYSTHATNLIEYKNGNISLVVLLYRSFMEPTPTVFNRKIQIV